MSALSECFCSEMGSKIGLNRRIEFECPKHGTVKIIYAEPTEQKTVHFGITNHTTNPSELKEVIGRFIKSSPPLRSGKPWC